MNRLAKNAGLLQGGSLETAWERAVVGHLPIPTVRLQLPDGQVSVMR
jgi:hypothetical protein